MSEDYELLFNNFKAKLYSPSEKFTRRLLVTPSDSLAQTLEKKTVEDEKCQVFFAIQSLNLHLAMQRLLELVFPEVRFPSLVDILVLMEKYLQEAKEKQAADFIPILDYIGEDKEKKNKLFSDLSSLFFEYSLFGDETLLETEGWQQELFRSIFTHFDLPFQAFLRPFPPLSLSCPYQVFIFGITFIPKIYMEFLEKITKFSDKIEVNIYFVSYTPYYFGDYLSSKEQKRKNKEELELLHEQNPLFANLCTLAKPFLNLTVDRGYVTEEFYNGKIRTSLLTHIQADLFELVNPLDIATLTTNSLDRSILVFEANSKFREVETVRDELLYKIETENISAENIVVFAPDINLYVPYIEYIFGSEASPVGYLISSAKRDKDNAFFFLLHTLFHLFESRWEFKEMVDLLESPIISKKFSFDVSDSERFIYWLEKTGMVWGFNLFHRKEFIQVDVPISSEGTLENSFSKIALGLCVKQHFGVDPLFYSPLEIDMPLCQEALSIMEFFSMLYSSVNTLKKMKAPLHVALKSLLKFIEEFASPPAKMKEERKAFEDFQSDLSRLFQSLAFIKEEIFSFEFILYVVKQQLDSYKGRKVSIGDKPRILFKSLTLGSSYGKDLIVCMGLSQSAFPKAKEKKDFDLLFKKSRAPSPYEVDRYAFLEMIMSARSSLIFSYTKKDENGEEEGPSYLIIDLLFYLKERGVDHAFSMTQKIDDFNLSYEALKKCYDPLYLELAQEVVAKFPGSEKSATLQQAEEAKGDFSDPADGSLPKRVGEQARVQFVSKTQVFSSESSENFKDEKTTLDMSELVQFAKNPLQFFYKNFFDSFLHKDREEMSKNKEFLLTPLDIGLLRFKWLSTPREMLEQDYAFARPFFNSIYQKNAYMETIEELQKLEDRLTQFGLLKSDFFSIHLTPFAKQLEQVSPILWEHPPILLETGEGQSIELIGELPLVTKKGLIGLKKATLEDLYSLWPSFLVYHVLAKDDQNKELILLKDGKKKEKINDPLRALSSFVNLTMLGKEKPLFTFPHLVEPLFKMQEQKFFEKLLEKGEDPYIKWFLSSLNQKAFSIDFSQMALEAKEVLIPFLEWYAGI